MSTIPSPCFYFEYCFCWILNFWLTDLHLFLFPCFFFQHFVCVIPYFGPPLFLMEMLANAIAVIILRCKYMYQIKVLYALNLHCVICQLYLNKAGKERPEMWK